MCQVQRRKSCQENRPSDTLCVTQKLTREPSLCHLCQVQRRKSCQENRPSDTRPSDTPMTL